MISVSDGSVQGPHLLRIFSYLVHFPHHLEKLHVQVALGRSPTPHSSPQPGRSPDVGSPYRWASRSQALLHLLFQRRGDPGTTVAPLLGPILCPVTGRG